MADDLRPTVQALLRALPTRKLDALKQLFWSELNYDRAGATLSMAGWPGELQATVAEAPQVFATAGEGDGFQVIYCRLRGVNQGQTQPLALGDERALVGKLLREHPYALFIFSNAAQDHWHFVNVKYEQDAEARARRVFRRISVSPYETAGPEQRLRTATERLSLLDIATLAPTLTGVSPFVVQNRHDAAFDVEAVTRDFFATYRTVFEQVEKLVTGLRGEEERLFTQRLFNRLLFLIFLERKGWLTFAGRSDYLRALWEAHRRDEDAGDGENFYRDRLRLLFFSGLNTPNEVDVVGANRHGFLQQRIGHVPYLNGGLFEEDASDRNSAVVVPDRAIDLILTRLLYHYNFTITESTPLDVEVAVDPEMLGKIFEELVTGRHESGSYYTPKPVVAFMGQEALKGYMESACAGEERAALAAFVERRDPAALRRPDGVLNALRQVTICDPACGSGAYLLGMMHELMDLRGALAARATVDHQTLYEQKLEIIQRNLYGVDIDPFAVNIARLRLWLSLIVEYEGETPPPLPNLDFKIEIGDSLIGPNPSKTEQPDLFRESQLQQFYRLRETYLDAHGSAKIELRRQIAELRLAISELVEIGHQGYRGFDWAVEFYEVFATGGFDIVLANPPYVNMVEMDQSAIHDRDLIRAQFQTATKGFDLFVPFMERGVQLLCPTGIFAYITPNKILAADYAISLRRFIAERMQLLLIADLSSISIFDASVYPVITVAKRKSANMPSTVRIYRAISENKGEPRLVFEHFTDTNIAKSTKQFSWSTLLHTNAARLSKVLSRQRRMQDIAEISGAATVSEAYEWKDAIINNGIDLMENDPNRFVPFIVSGNVRSHFHTWSNEKVQYLKDAYRNPVLDVYHSQISARRRTQIRSEKVVVSGMSKRPTAVYCPDYLAAGKSTVILMSSNVSGAFISALLNSSIMSDIYTFLYGSLSLSGGYLRFGPPQLRELPIPSFSSSQHDEIVDIVTELMTEVDPAKPRDVDHQYSELLRNELDRLVEALYQVGV
jgi:type I restriction-modification system DNA methylase subunit